MRKVKVVTWFLCIALLMGMCPFPLLAEGAGVSALTLTSCAPAGAFTGGGFQVSLGTVDEEAGKLPVNMDIKLDSSTEVPMGYLPQHYENALESSLIEPKTGQSAEEYRDYLNGLSGPEFDEALPLLSLTCTFAGVYLDLPTPAEGAITVSNGIGTVGSYLWEQDENSNLKFTITMDRYIYACQNVVLHCQSSLSLKQGVRVEDAPPTLQLGEDKLITVLGLTDKEDPTEQYAISKSAPAQVDTPSIPYTITAARKLGAGGSLAGKLLRDELPQGLMPAKCTVAFDGGIPIPLTDLNYTFQDGVFTYVIPQEAASCDQVTLTLTARLDEEHYRDFTAGTLADPIYRNSADLVDEDETTVLLSSNEVTTALKAQFFSKTGEQDKRNSRLFHWVITVDSYANADVSAYLVDRLNSSVLAIEGDVTVTIGGATRTLTKRDLASGPSYDGITQSLVQEDGLHLSDNALIGQDADACYSYIQGEEGLMILPFSQYMGKKVEIRYDTLINDSLLNRPGQTEVTVENDAKLVWNYFGEGVGPWTPDIGFQVEKRADLLMVEKSAEPYRQGRPIRWNFRANPGQGAISDLVMTDTVHTDTLKYSPITELPIYSIGEDGKPEAAPVFTLREQADGKGRFFSCDEDSTAKTQTVTVHLGDLTKDDQYSFTLSTDLVGELSATQTKNAALPNTATVTGTVGSTNLTQHPDATAAVTNVFVQKSNQLDGKISVYDYRDHSLGWTVTVNPNHETIRDLKLTDLLPTGTTAELISLTRTAEDGSSEEVLFPSTSNTITFSDKYSVTVEELTSGETEEGYLKNWVVLNFPETSDRFNLQLKTILSDEEYRHDKLDPGDALQVLNQVKLSGKVNGHELQDAQAMAVNTLRLPPLGKNGVYHQNEAYPGLDSHPNLDYITWSVLVNKNQTVLSGQTVTDHLPDHMELDPGSLKFYSAEVTGDGSGFQQGALLSESESKSFGLQSDSRGFSLTIPESHAQKPFFIKFDTLLTEVSSSSQMKNEVSLSYGDRQVSTGQQQAGGSHNFDFAAYHRAVSLPNLTLRKLSANTSGEGLPLAGASFALEPVAWSGTDWTATGPQKVKTTGADGRALFLFLKTDTIYRIRELEAPAGYKNMADPLYFSIAGRGVDGSYEEHGTVIHTGKGGGESFSFDLTNELEAVTPPDGGEPVAGGRLTFRKRTETGTPLAGVTFTLTAPNFATLTTASDTAGLVTFENLDPNIPFTLTETTPQGFQPLSAPLTALVTFRSHQFQTVLKLGGRELPQEEGVYVLDNSPIRGTVSLVKRDSVSKVPLSGAAFTVYTREGERPVARLEESGTPGTYRLAPLPEPAADGLGQPYVRESAGSWALLSGDYYLVETTTPAGYLRDLEADGLTPRRHAFQITAQGQTVHITNSADGFTNDPCGTVQGAKLDTGKNPLAGALMGLFPQDAADFTRAAALRTAVSGSDGTFTFSQVPYGTYLVAEIHAPSGYYLNQTDRFTVTVGSGTPITQDTTGSPLTLENTRIPYSPSLGTLTIEKSSEDGKREGFSFRITGEGYDRTLQTDGDGRILLRDLALGSYRVCEVDDGAVHGIYTLPAPQTAQVTVRGAKLDFYNRLIPSESPSPSQSDGPTPSSSPDGPEVSPDGPSPSVSPAPQPSSAPTPNSSGSSINGPHTGYDSHSGLWLAVLLLSLCGLALAVSLLRRPRRKGRREL